LSELLLFGLDFLSSSFCALELVNGLSLDLLADDELSTSFPSSVKPEF